MSVILKSNEVDPSEIQKRLAGKPLSSGAMLFFIRAGIFEPPADYALSVELFDMMQSSRILDETTPEEWEAAKKQKPKEDLASAPVPLQEAVQVELM